jgi:hypothetical protein
MHIFQNRNILLTVFIFCNIALLGQNITVSGYVTDKQSGERLIGANIFSKATFKGTSSNNYGFYSLTVPAGEVTLVCSFIGYEKQQVEVNSEEDPTLNFELQPQTDELDEVVVLGNAENKVEQVQMSMVTLPVQQIQKVPVILGEADVLKTVQLFPGIQSGLEGTSGIYVRGGSNDQNLFLIDGVPVYSANHLLGFFSTFNPDAVKSVNVYKGGFPARFGGRLSSVVDVWMKDGNLKKLTGSFSIGLISSKLMLEGPLIKDKTSFMVSARRTYADLIAKPVLAYMNRNSNTKTSLDLYFYDINAKISHTFSDRSRLYWSIYNGSDKFAQGENSDNAEENREATISAENDMGMGWSNTVSSLRWNYLLSNKLFSNTSLSYSKFLFDVEYSNIKTYQEENLSVKDYYRYYSGIEDIALKIDFDYFPTQKHTFKFGSSAIRHRFSPGVSLTEEDDTDGSQKDTYANGFSAYIEDEFSVSGALTINMGVHLSLFNVERTNYFRPQPRVSLHYRPFESLALKASYSRMVQHLHLLNSSGLELPMDLWVPVTAKYEPPVSDQFAFGTAINFLNAFNLTFEGFYKNMKNLIEYREGASYTGGGVNWEDIVEKGIGWSYGAELLLEKTMGKTTGWLGYTWSKTERQFENINYGEPFPYKYDRRHDISLVVSHKFNERIDVSGTWVYSTGRAATVAFSRYPLTGVPTYNPISTYYVYNYKGRNGYRLPDYHRLDLGVNFKKKKKHGVRTWNISVCNIYNRLNAFMLISKTDYNRGFIDENGIFVHPEKLYMFSLFPLMPSISYSYKF